MNISPWMLAAAVSVPLMGAIAGASMDTDPIGIGSDITDALPNGTLSVAEADALRWKERLPDHYPMMTPEGLVEVGELAWRGRYRDRYRTYADYAPTEYDYAAELAHMEARWDARQGGAAETRAQAALDAQQPDLQPRGRYAQIPHYEAWARFDGGLESDATAPARIEPAMIQAANNAEEAAMDAAIHSESAPVTLAFSEEIGSSARMIDIEKELAR